MDSAPGERILARLLEDEMRESFIDYSMSVIVRRALPDVRDGLKPVHRRILYAMSELGLGPGRPYKKSATVVGEVLGKYHPHGDSAVYDSMARMVQDFSLRYPLVDGQGNFGSIDGDSPAAYRYTEARLTPLATQLLTDIDEETVDFIPNFDGRIDEPTVLPARAPNLLVNGSSGIAVGMATNIPPHNLREVVDATIALIENPDLPQEVLESIVTGPDFPTGAFICGRRGIRDAYRTGRGRIVMRARTDVEEAGKRTNARIVVRAIPFMVNKTRLIEQIAQMVREKKLTQVSALRDESDRDGMRIVIELKRGTVPQVVLNLLYKHTQMQATFGTILLALVNGVPRVMGLREILFHFVDHRHDVVVRRSEFRLAKAREREHILEGLKIAVDNIDRVIAIIRSSTDTPTARARLRAEPFSSPLTERQAEAILNMRLARLTGLEIDKLERELADVRAVIAELDEILSSRPRRMQIIVEELQEVAKRFRGRPADRDPHRRGRPGDGGPHQGRGGRAHRQPAGLPEAHPAGHLPRAAARGTRAQGHGHQGRGRGRAPLRGLHPRLPDDLHPVGEVPLDQGLGGARRGTLLAREAGGEPAQHRPEARDRGVRAGAHLRAGLLPAVLHPQGHRQEDAAVGLRQRPHGGHPRHSGG